MTIDQVAKPDCYPIPRIDYLFASLSNGERFTKLDMSNAYQQLVLDKKIKGTDNHQYTQGVVPVSTFAVRCISCSSDMPAYHGMYAARYSTCVCLSG